MKITLEFINKGATSGIGFSRRHVELLGGEWPLTRGWKGRLVGREISDGAAEAYLALNVPPPSCEGGCKEGRKDV